MNETHFEIMSGPTYPLSFRAAVLLTFAFVFLAIPVARRNRFPLVVLALPFWWSFAAVFLGLANVAAAQSFSGVGRFAAAAGVAEAHIPIKWGCFAIAAATTIYAWKASNAGALQAGSTKLLLSLATAAVALMAADYWLSSQLLFPNTAHAEWKFNTAVGLATTAGFVCLSSLALLIPGRGVAASHVSRRSALAFAVLALGAAMAFREIVLRLQKYAMGT